MAYLGRVYKVSREGESRVYIGQTKKAIEERFKEHLIKSKATDAFHRRIQQVGAAGWKVELLEEGMYSSRESLLKREQFHIQSFASRGTIQHIVGTRKGEGNQKKNGDHDAGQHNRNIR